MALELRQLRHFQALANHKSIGETARSLSISQPSLSRSLQALEENLQLVLFDRSRRGIELTPAGEHLLANVDRLLRHHDYLVEDLRQYAELERGELKLALGVYPAELSASKAIGELSRSHPGLRLKLRVADWRSVRHLVREGRVHAAVAEISGIEDDHSLTVLD